jgi:hypothetical protein
MQQGTLQVGQGTGKDIDGTEVIKDDAEIRLFDHFGSGIVVFWTIRPDAIPAFKDQHTASEEQAEHSRSLELREKAVVQQRIIEQEKAQRENKDEISMPLIRLLYVCLSTLAVYHDRNNPQTVRFTNVTQKQHFPLAESRDIFRQLCMKFPRLLQTDWGFDGTSSSCFNCSHISIPGLDQSRLSKHRSYFGIRNYVDHLPRMMALAEKIYLDLRRWSILTHPGLWIITHVTLCLIVVFPQIIFRLCSAWSYAIPFQLVWRTTGL